MAAKDNGEISDNGVPAEKEEALNPDPTTKGTAAKSVSEKCAVDANGGNSSLGAPDAKATAVNTVPDRYPTKCTAVKSVLGYAHEYADESISEMSCLDIPLAFDKSMSYDNIGKILCCSYRNCFKKVVLCYKY